MCQSIDEHQLMFWMATWGGFAGVVINIVLLKDISAKDTREILGAQGSAFVSSPGSLSDKSPSRPSTR